MIDEGTLKSRFPEIPWDQPVNLRIADEYGFPYAGFACRYCIALFGLSAQDVLGGRSVGVYKTRQKALDHIERSHHD